MLFPPFLIFLVAIFRYKVRIRLPGRQFGVTVKVDWHQGCNTFMRMSRYSMGVLFVV